VLVLSFIFVAQGIAQGARGEVAAPKDDQALEMLRQVMQFIKNNYVEEVDTETLIDGALKGMFESLDDPYSMFLDVSSMRGLTDTTSGEFGGVGLYINKVVPPNDKPWIRAYVEIVAPIEDTPGFRSGLMPGDLITAIEDSSTEELTIDEVVDRLRGTPGTDVTISILRGESARFNVTLTRAIIEIPTVKYEPIKQYGYLRIIQFTPATDQRVAEALQNLRQGGMQGLIIDLRTNPGGLLTSVVDTADHFFDDGLIVGTRGRVLRENQTFMAEPGSLVSEGLPIVVLVDEGTASAAEILAGVLRNRDRAVLIGRTTYGKGSVQQIHALGDKGFRLTMSKYYTPGNVYIDKVGIEPDIELGEPELSAEEEADFIELTEGEFIQSFLDENSDPNSAQIKDFIETLQEEDGIELSERLLRRLIRREYERRTNTSSVYDLEYDIVLQRALEVIGDPAYIKELIEKRDPLDADFSRSHGLPVPALSMPQ
jgi:carboxyl-terminal processing protease